MTESRIEARIRELGYELPVAPAPVAAYVPAVTSGSYVYTSGQLPFVDGALPETGKVSDSGAEGFVTPENAKKYAVSACSTPWRRSSPSLATWTACSAS